MGMIASYQCRACGYDSGELGVGIAPNPRRHDPVLVSCAKCQELSTVHRPKVKKGCPKCQGPLVQHPSWEVEGDEGPPCPRCGKLTERKSVGMWD